jgi:uncharacterized protein YbjT (DUF2867 family)
MSETGLHVVFGVGQVGHAVIARLLKSGEEVRAVSVHRPSAPRLRCARSARSAR